MAFEGEIVDAAKTKAHATQEDVDSRRTIFREKKGNDHADRLAKLGAPLAGGATDTHNACKQVVKKAAKWAAGHEIWLGDRGMLDALTILRRGGEG